MAAPRPTMALITGALGSGKTTLLRQLLLQTDRRIAVLMNEFGQLAIDSQVIRGRNIEVVELTGGCVCCSLAGELEAAVQEIVETYRPETILLEATGVAEADALAFQVGESLPQVRLDSVIYVLDAYAATRTASLGHVTLAQLEAADIVLINKIDLLSSAELAQAERLARQYNAEAALVRTVRCDADPDVLLGPPLRSARPVATPQGTEGFTSFSFETSALLHHQDLIRVMEQLPETVYRAKGLVHTDQGEFLLNVVAGRLELEQFPAHGTQLVFIGHDLDALRGDLFDRLQRCRRAEH